MQANLELDPRESHSDAPVPTVAESEVRVRVPMRTKLVGIGKHIGIAIGDIKYGDDDFALRYQAIVQLHVRDSDVRLPSRAAGPAVEPHPAEQFFDGGWDLAGVAAKCVRQAGPFEVPR